MPEKQPGLSRSRVAGAALSFAKKHGVDALSIERLAAELRATPAGIKRFAATRRELMALVRDAALEAVPGLAREGKKRRRYRSLTEDQILEAALAIVKREGTESLSMRALAKDLGVSVMALYHHVPSKEALLERVWLAVLSRAPGPKADKARWEEELTDYAVSGVVFLAQYPGLLKYGLSRKASDVDLQVNARVHDVLKAAGFDERAAAYGTITLHMFLLGTSVIISRSLGISEPLKGRGFDRVLDPRFHELRTLVEFSVRTIVRGLRGELPATQRTRRTRKRAR